MCETCHVANTTLSLRYGDSACYINTPGGIITSVLLSSASVLVHAQTQAREQLVGFIYVVRSTSALNLQNA